MRKSSAATSKPASKPAGKPTTGNAGKNSTSAGSKLWEKKPFDKSNKPSSFKGSKPYGDKGDGSKKYVNFIIYPNLALLTPETADGSHTGHPIRVPRKNCPNNDCFRFAGPIRAT
jgi:hypothetical protein